MRGERGIIGRAQAPAHVLRLGVIMSAITVERVLAEDGGDLERVGELVGAAAPPHGGVEQAGDVEAFVCDAGAVHLEQRDAGGVAADRRPHREAEPVHGHRHVLDDGAEPGEPLGGIAHAAVDVRLRVGMAEAFAENSHAQAFDSAVERLGIAARCDAALARVDAVGPGDHFQQQGVVAHVGGHRAAGVERDLERRNPGVGHQPVGRLQSDDAAMAGGDADRAGLVAADRHVDVAGGDQGGAAGGGAAGRVAGLARILHRAGRTGVASSRYAIILAHRLAGDLAAGVEDALDHGRIDVRHVARKDVGADHHRHPGEADIILERDPPAGELAAGRCP